MRVQTAIGLCDPMRLFPKQPRRIERSGDRLCYRDKRLLGTRMRSIMRALVSSARLTQEQKQLHRIARSDTAVFQNNHTGSNNPVIVRALVTSVSLARECAI